MATTLFISRSSLYYRKKPRGSRSDRTYDEQIVVACGEELAYGYRLVVTTKERSSRESQTSAAAMRERGLVVRPRRLRARRRKEWGRRPNEIWQSDMTKVWAGPSVGWTYLVSVIDCCTREIVGWNLSHRCRTEDALATIEQAVLERLPEGRFVMRTMRPLATSLVRVTSAPWALMTSVSAFSANLPLAKILTGTRRGTRVLRRRSGREPEGIARSLIASGYA